MRGGEHIDQEPPLGPVHIPGEGERGGWGVSLTATPDSRYLGTVFESTKQRPPGRTTEFLLGTPDPAVSTGTGSASSPALTVQD